jgi:hypothetical protein
MIDILTTVFFATIEVWVLFALIILALLAEKILEKIC